MQELDAKLKQLPVWELATYMGALETGGPPESLSPPVGSKPWKEDREDIDEDGDCLYVWQNKYTIWEGLWTKASVNSGDGRCHLYHK